MPYIITRVQRLEFHQMRITYLVDSALGEVYTNDRSQAARFGSVIEAKAVLDKLPSYQAGAAEFRILEV